MKSLRGKIASVSGKESEGNFRKETGKWAIAGGVIAGIIGLVTNPNLAIAAAGLLIGGWILRKD